MIQATISVCFFCKLCRGSFRQVVDFIEHKKEKHFTEFQNTSCIVFEESSLCPVIINAENQPTDESNVPPLKIELNAPEPIIPFNSETVDGQNLSLVEPNIKIEQLTYDSEIKISDSFCLEQPEQKPYVLLKRLTFDEIQRACTPKQNSRLLGLEQKNFTNDLEPPSSPDVHRNFIDPIEFKNSTQVQPTATIINMYAESDVQFECKLCSKQLESEPQLKIHVGICALYHEDRNRFCVPCNKKLFNPWGLKNHCLAYHGTEEEKASLYKFKCHLCPKQHRSTHHLRVHLETHKEKKTVNISPSPSKSFKCSQPNCGKSFTTKLALQRHTATLLASNPSAVRVRIAKNNLR